MGLQYEMKTEITPGFVCMNHIIEFCRLNDDNGEHAQNPSRLKSPQINNTTCIPLMRWIRSYKRTLICNVYYM